MIVICTLLLVLTLFCSVFLVVTGVLGGGGGLRRRGLFLSMRRRQCRGLEDTVRRTERTQRSVHRRFVRLSTVTGSNSLRGVGGCLRGTLSGVPALSCRFYRGRSISGMVKCCCTLTRGRRVPFSTHISLPGRLSMSRVSLYLVLSGLLRGTLRTDHGATTTRRQVSLRVCRRSTSVLLVQIRGGFSKGVGRGSRLFRSAGQAKLKINARSIHEATRGGSNSYSFACRGKIFATGVVLHTAP